jgi:hypothetical protein
VTPIQCGSVFPLVERKLGEANPDEQKPIKRPSFTNPVTNDRNLMWRSLHAHDFFLFSRSYHSAAKKLARMLDLERRPIPDFDLCPVLSAYRHAIELHLKVIVLGDDGNFLATKPDEISVHKTRSLSWLAKFICQIVTTSNGKGNSRTMLSRALPISRP